MPYSIPSYVVLIVLIGLILYVIKRTTVKEQEPPMAEMSSYARAIKELSRGRFSETAKVMYPTLKNKAELLEGPSRERADVLLKKLSKASKNEKKVDFLSLFKEYNSTINEKNKM